MPRSSWRKGCVKELHAGDYNIIRSASVKIYQKNSDTTIILKRPLQHLVLLETTIKEPGNESQFSRREAAMNADVIRKLTTCLCYDPNLGGECLDYSESLHVCNTYPLDISFTEFLCRFNIQKILSLKPDMFFKFFLPILTLGFKDRILGNLKSNFVFEFKCGNFIASYHRNTYKDMEIRVSEHQIASPKKVIKSKMLYPYQSETTC